MKRHVDTESLLVSVFFGIARWHLANIRVVFGVAEIVALLAKLLGPETEVLVSAIQVRTTANILPV